MDAPSRVCPRRTLDTKGVYDASCMPHDLGTRGAFDASCMPHDVCRRRQHRGLAASALKQGSKACGMHSVLPSFWGVSVRARLLVLDDPPHVHCLYLYAKQESPRVRNRH